MFPILTISRQIDFPLAPVYVGAVLLLEDKIIFGTEILISIVLCKVE